MPNTTVMDRMHAALTRKKLRRSATSPDLTLTFTGHTAAVQALQVNGGYLFSCSGDKCIRQYNVKVSTIQSARYMHL